MFWLTGPTLVDVLAAAIGRAVAWCPSRADAGSGRELRIPESGTELATRSREHPGRAVRR